LGFKRGSIISNEVVGYDGDIVPEGEDDAVLDEETGSFRSDGTAGYTIRVGRAGLQGAD
jgi:hypothetical protein